VSIITQSLEHLVISVGNVEVTAAWYQRVLGMNRQDRDFGEGTVRTALHFGNQKINLRPIDASKHDRFTADNDVYQWLPELQNRLCEAPPNLPLKDQTLDASLLQLLSLDESSKTYPRVAVIFLKTQDGDRLTVCDAAPGFSQNTPG
jgi:catechol 2,3-dioxygenase-like lactoylglutathione lyase family enzyme